MLNGIAPILIFQFSKKLVTAEAVSKIPILSSLVSSIPLPPIPLYLDEKLTGIIIDSEDKNIDIETSQETLTDGGSPLVTQKAIESVVKINMRASKDSIGLTILSAVADMILPKVTSQEYSIQYLNGATTMFNARLKSFQVNSSSDNTLLNITLELIKGDNKTVPNGAVPETQRYTEAVPLQNGIPPTAPNVPPVTGPTFTPTTPQPTQPPVRVNLG
jgi:hypothetical protein